MIGLYVRNHIVQLGLSIATPYKFSLKEKEKEIVLRTVKSSVHDTCFRSLDLS